MRKNFLISERKYVQGELTCFWSLHLKFYGVSDERLNSVSLIVPFYDKI